MWNVDIVEILEHSDDVYNSPKKEKVNPGLGQVKVAHVESFGSDSSSLSLGSERFQRQEVIVSSLPLYPFIWVATNLRIRKISRNEVGF